MTDLSMSLIVKLASLVVHCDEATQPDGHPFDFATIRSLVSDDEVRTWLLSIDPVLLPRKRSDDHEGDEA